MTVRTTNLGGSNFVDNEILTTADLNDTINAMANYAKTLTAFWLNSNLRTVWDDFSTYTTDANVPTTLWTHTAGTFITRESSTAGNTLKEGQFTTPAASSSTVTRTITTKSLTANKHKHMNLYVSIAGGIDPWGCVGRLTVSFDGSTNKTIMELTKEASTANLDTNYCLTSITVIAKGSDEYDCYIGGKLVQTVTDSTFNLSFTGTSSSSAGDGPSIVMYISEIYESAGTL